MRKKTSRSASATRKAPAGRRKGGSGSTFPIVGIGASAGGLEAVQRLLAAIGPRARLAILYVQHLHPGRESLLVPLLAARTRLTVVEATGGLRVAAGHVYIAPPHTDVSLRAGVLRVRRLSRKERPARTIDACFTALAADRREDAIGLVLSGSGDDGSAGIVAIKKAGGVALAQEPGSAKFDGMPASAIATGVIDVVATPEELGVRLTRMARLPPAQRVLRTKGAAPAASASDDPGDALAAIFDELRSAGGIDFNGYKRAMVLRRIRRRMGLRGLADLRAYASHLRANPDAVVELRQDLLIRVTGFFRDPAIYQLLERRAVPVLRENRPPGAPIRVWVPGCATGEEAYSIAMCLLDAVGDAHPLQVFATDVQPDALDHARAGIYSAAAVEHVPAARRARFFRKLDNGSFVVHKRLRDACVFACHDLARDPPFSRLDLVSCRNVLIYLQPALQRRILRVFHYALNPRGCLMLGAAESAAGSELFVPLGGKQRKIYQRRATTAQRRHGESVLPEATAGPTGRARPPRAPTDTRQGASDLTNLADRITLARYSPPGVLVDERLEVIQFRGDTSPHLQQPAGQATLALTKLVRHELALDLRAALGAARKQAAPVRVGAFRRTRPQGAFVTSIEVIPIRLPGDQGGGFLVLFHDAPVVDDAPAARTTRPGRAARPPAPAATRRADRLESELATTRAQLRAAVEEHEATNEELRGAMEEVTSTNEELQSINEEMETAKEELQSANEELTTINDELQQRNVELNQVNVDLQNLLSSVDIPIVMLGRNLAIRRFTASVQPLFHLIAGDLGRPIVDLRSNLDLPDLDGVLGEVIARGKPLQREVRDSAGRIHSLWIRPYLTADGRCDGAVMTFFDISERKRAEDALQLYAERLRLLGEIDSAVLAGHTLTAVTRLALPRIRRFLAAAHAGVLLLDQHGGEASILVGDQDPPEPVTEPLGAPMVPGRSQEGRGGLALTSTANLCLPDLAALAGREPSLERFVRAGMRSFLSVPLAVEGRVIGRLFAAAGQPNAFADEDVQLAREVADHLAVAIEQTRLYEQVRAARERLANLAARLVAAQEAERRRVARELHDEVGQVLTGLKLALAAVATRSAAVEVETGIAQVDRLIATVRALSLDLRPTVLDDLGLLPALLTHNERFTTQTGVRVRMEHQGIDRRFSSDVETAAYRIVQEALTNVARHAGVPQATVRLWGDAERLTIQVSDEGAGFDPTAVAAARSSTGLSGMTERAVALGGELSVDTAPGHGTRLLAVLPLAVEQEGG